MEAENTIGSSFNFSDINQTTSDYLTMLGSGISGSVKVPATASPVQADTDEQVAVQALKNALQGESSQ
jgi:hypothetical protein